MPKRPPLLDALPLKIGEADYFLEKLEVEHNPVAAEYLFSAFASAARSVTWVMQKCMAGVDGFDEWYAPRQTALKHDQLARFMKELRNVSQKDALRAISGGQMDSADGRIHSIRLYFDATLTSAAGIDASQDVVSLCQKFFVRLVSLVDECLRDFQEAMDPHRFITPQWLADRSMTIEDLEARLGYPRGWTSVIGGREEWPNRIRALLLREPAWPDISEIVERRVPRATT